MIIPLIRLYIKDSYARLLKNHKASDNHKIYDRANLG